MWRIGVERRRLRRGGKYECKKRTGEDGIEKV